MGAIYYLFGVTMLNSRPLFPNRNNISRNLDIYNGLEKFLFLDDRLSYWRDMVLYNFYNNKFFITC